jgi:hypothetical protein
MACLKACLAYLHANGMAFARIHTHVDIFLGTVLNVHLFLFMANLVPSSRFAVESIVTK